MGLYLIVIMMARYLSYILKYNVYNTHLDKFLIYKEKYYRNIFSIKKVHILLKNSILFCNNTFKKTYFRYIIFIKNIEKQ